MSLFDRLAEVQGRIGQLPSRLGDPRYLPVSIVWNAQEILLSRLRVTRIAPEKIGMYLSDNVQLLGDEYLISAIPRIYSLDALKRGIWKIDGKTADLIYLDEAKSNITVRAIVRLRDSGK